MRPVSKKSSKKGVQKGRRREENASNSSSRVHSRSAHHSEKSLLKKTINKQKCQKWRLLQNSTKVFVTSLIQTYADNVTAEGQVSQRSAIQDTIDQLKNRTFQKLERTRAPGSLLDDYTSMVKQRKKLQKIDNDLKLREEALEKAIENTTALIDKTQKEISQMEKKNDNDAVKTILFTDSEDVEEGSARIGIDFETVELYIATE